MWAAFFPLVCIISYSSGLILSLAARSFLPIWCMPALCAALLLYANKYKAGGALLLSLLILGLFIGSVRIGMLQSSSLAGLEGKRAAIDLTVSSPLEPKGQKITFVAHATQARWQGLTANVDEDVLVEAFCGEGCPPEIDDLSEGSLASAQANISVPASTPGSDFDYGLYLRRRGINVTLAVSPDRLKILDGRRGGFQGVVDRLRMHARSSLRTVDGTHEKGLWGSAECLLQAMVLGDDHVVSDELISDFRDAGLLHMLAVSGQNVVLLGFIVLIFLRLIRVPRLPATAGAAAVIIVYVPLTGSGPSIVRAGIVGVLGMAALVLSRQTDRCYFLALAAAAILSLNPYSLLDPGFQLSFASVLAIFFIAPVFSNLLSFMPMALREAVAISTATGLATAPITLSSFHQVSLVTVPANVAAAPVAGPIMLLGVLAVATKPFLPLLAWIFVAGASICTGYMIVTARFFAGLPNSVFSGESPGLIVSSAYYCMLAAMVVISRKAAGGWEAVRLKSRKSAIALLMLLALTGIFVVGFSCASGAAGPPPGVFTVSFLDVGQGDAILIQEPPGEGGPQGYTVLIDGGPGDDVVDRLAECGVERLDAVFLTHPDADHLAGLLPVLNSLPVASVFDAAPPSGGSMYSDFQKLIEKKGITYHVTRRGDSVTYGDLRIEVLNPGDNLREGESNANSVVLLAGYRDLDILLPGDAEGDLLSTLEIDPVEIYKVPHHGSRDGSAAAVLEKIDPEVAVISVGEGNRYGHPAEQTLDALKEEGATIFRTDWQGTVAISLDEGNMKISTRK